MELELEGPDLVEKERAPRREAESMRHRLPTRDEGGQQRRRPLLIEPRTSPRTRWRGMRARMLGVCARLGLRRREARSAHAALLQPRLAKLVVCLALFAVTQHFVSLAHLPSHNEAPSTSQGTERWATWERTRTSTWRRCHASTG